ncbi:MAG: hypothetical protein LQ347_005319 [Umbilicaria vellea]|nr:MAG: hypothetical protein LQ347_005319 [Umbilicaria vellea]
MAGTRSSARQAAQASSSPNSSQGKAAANSGATGSKRKAEVGAASKSKRGKKGNAKEQKTIEETMPDKEEEEAAKDVEMEDAAGSEKPAEEVVEKKDNGALGDAQKDLKDREDAVAAREEAIKEKEEASKEEQVAEVDDGTSAADGKPNGEESSKKEDASMMDDTDKVEPEDNVNSGTEEGAVQESSERDDSTPSSILEKGIIYFFFRGRVGIDEPSEVGDLARSYIVLRPLPHGAKLGEGAIGDAGNYRLLALPKKVLPKSPQDRFMIFVEKANTSMEDIKNNHLTSSDYETKTAGARHTPAATPVAEGVYAITTTGRESHLAYILTIPAELSEVQEDVGLRARGSFVTSVKNPQYSGPAGANLPQGPEYPKEYVRSRPSP